MEIRASLPLAFATGLVLCSVVALQADASRFGRNGFSGNPDINGGSDCTVCHAPGAPLPFVTIAGPTTVDAGTVNSYTVTIVGGPAVIGGVNVSVSDEIGELTPGDGSTQLIEGELAHTEPQAFNGDQLVFSFDWTAPNYDTDVTVYAAGNSTTGNLDLAGDGVGTNSLLVTVINGFEDPPPPPPPPTPGLIELVPLAGGFNAPVALANAGDDRLFVVEQRGKVRLIDGSGQVPPTDFLDIEDRVKFNNSEEGLLGIAFHPNYAENGYFYLNYIFDPGPGNDRTRVSRFQVTADPNVADPASELVLVEFNQDFSNHNGGDLKFGPDGHLYIASGDGGSGDDPNNRAQTTDTLMGKILRIDVDTPPGPDNSPDCTLVAEANYAIPPSNAFNDGVGGAGCDEIYAFGIRNPWRISFDRDTGDLWIGDVGQNAVEEIDFILAGSGGGLNFGWRCYEGSRENILNGCDDSYVFPVFEYLHAVDGNCSVTGGFVYRGQDFPELQGQYFFSDFCNSSIRSLAGPVNDLIETVVLPAGEVLFTTFGEDVRGELYGADFLTGTIFQITAAEVDVPGDVDGDGDVDRIDLREIFLAVPSPADGPDDPRDVDGNGFITRADLREAFLNCTRPGCAVN